MQQGTVNSPILFNTYFSELLDHLTARSVSNIAFADDLIIYSADSKASTIQSMLQNNFDLVTNYCTLWKLKVNNDKCEVILFRDSLDKVNMDVRKNWRQFHIRTPCGTILKNKKVVKYLGVYFHQNLNFSMHIKNTIKKASQAFYAAKKLFYSKMLEARVKIICYLSLICPTLTYASPIWFNISASNMEKLRLWERKSLRSCTGTYRKPQSNYLHYYSNETLYQNANINRIDNLSSIK